MTAPRLIYTPKLLCFGVMIAMASGGYAATILSVDNSATTIHYQQTADDPCIFGNSDCQGSAGFPTQTNTNIGGSTSIFDAGTSAGGASNGSPALFDVTAGQIRGLAGGTFGNVFLIGVDINQAGSDYLNVLQFEVWDTTTATQLAYLSVPTQLNVFKNGTGFTDALLSSVTICAACNDNIQFRLRYDNASDGPDSFFLVSTAAPPPQVPEPLTMGLTGAGLVGIFFLRRRRPSSV
jgi:PEP-CTERM motif